ncbi:MAG: F0F1 ATP synthase subunit A [Flavobacteriales bacterium]|jgi:F-type H+-transporting ATPase subunit a|nr:F0F1 ATP synthase subunit A [Flavobacteriales bacterium]
MNKLWGLLLVAAFFAPVLAFSSNGHENEHHGDGHVDKEWADMSKEERQADIKGHIQHHLLDSYEFNIMSDYSDKNNVKHYGFPLPVILWDEGLHVFMASEFEHGNAVAESNGKFYKLYHNKIYRVDSAEGHLSMDEHGHPTNATPFDLSITKNVLSSLLVALLIFFIFRGVAKAYKNTLSPTGSAKFFEPIILFVRDEIAIPNIGEKHYARYMSYLLTVFFFIWIVNLTGLTPLGINVTGNIAVTACLAIITFIITQVSGKKDYWMHIFWMPGVPVPMKIILAPIELLGVFIKPFALMIRLYANISAGHIVLMSLLALIFIFDNWFARGAFFGLSFLLSIIELLVAFLQAYIFTMLTALYFGSAVEEHDHEHAHAH